MPYVMTQKILPGDEIVPAVECDSSIDPSSLPPLLTSQDAEVILSAGEGRILHPWWVSGVIKAFYPGWKLVWRKNIPSPSASINFRELARIPSAPKIQCVHREVEVREIPAGWGQKVKIRRCRICGEVLTPAGGPG